MVADADGHPVAGHRVELAAEVGKVARLSRRVESGSATTRVRAEPRCPGGLNATWPSPAPEASRKRSTPPAAAIRSSYASGSAGSGSQSRPDGDLEVLRPARVEPVHDLHPPEPPARVRQRGVDRAEPLVGELDVLVHHHDDQVAQVQLLRGGQPSQVPVGSRAGSGRRDTPAGRAGPVLGGE